MHACYRLTLTDRAYTRPRMYACIHIYNLTIHITMYTFFVFHRGSGRTEVEDGRGKRERVRVREREMVDVFFLFLLSSFLLGRITGTGGCRMRDCLLCVTCGGMFLVFFIFLLVACVSFSCVSYVREIERIDD